MQGRGEEGKLEGNGRKFRPQLPACKWQHCFSLLEVPSTEKIRKISLVPASEKVLQTFGLCSHPMRRVATCI